MWWDWLAALLSIAIVVYLIVGGDDFTDRNTLPNSWDIFFGVALIVLVLEAMRRTIGWILPVISICFLLYAFLGAYLPHPRSEEHTSELQSLMRISYAVFCLKKKKK